jgi:hypothetical protein
LALSGPVQGFRYRGEILSLQKGQAILLNGGEYHKYYTNPSCDRWDFKWVRFVSDYMVLYDQLIAHNELNVVQVTDSHFEGYCDRVIRYIESDDKLKDFILCDLLSSI